MIGSRSAEEDSIEVEVRYDWLYAKGCSRGPDAGPIVGHATDWDCKYVRSSVLLYIVQSGEPFSVRTMEMQDTL